MTDTTSWDELSPEGALMTARYAFPGGTSRSTLLRWGEGVALIYSPGPGLLESAKELLEEDVELLVVAPSAGHSLGIAPWVSHFARSRVFAGEGALDRLTRRAKVAPGRSFESPAALAERLPAHVLVHEVPGCTLGEVWISVETETACTWLVSDAFMNIERLSERALLRGLQKLYGLRVGLSVGGAFRRSLSDREGFRAWASQRFLDGREHTLIPCHGEIVGGAGLGPRLVELSAPGS